MVAGTVVAVIGWALPLFGIPPAGFLLIDIALGTVRRRRATTPSALRGATR